MCKAAFVDSERGSMNQLCLVFLGVKPHTSLLKNSPATASIVTDSDEAVLLRLRGDFLRELFASHAELMGKFFCLLAVDRAEKSDCTEYLGLNIWAISSDEVSNSAFRAREKNRTSPFTEVPSVDPD